VWLRTGPFAKHVFAVSSTLRSQLFDELLYVNIHTPNASAGLIRGQLSRECDATVLCVVEGGVGSVAWGVWRGECGVPCCVFCVVPSFRK
jgi:hypothetical protein